MATQRPGSLMAGMVQTVQGPIPADDLGVTLPHERLIIGGWDHRETNYLNSLMMELASFTAEGGRTIVDIGAIGHVRDVGFQRLVAERTGVHVIASTGFRASGWLPPEVTAMSIDGMADVLVGEITDGTADGLRAGMIAMGVSRHPSPVDDRALAAAGRAQAATGVAVSLRLELGATMAAHDRALDLLEHSGADLGRVAVGNLIARPDYLPLCRRLAARGTFIAFDLFGQERRSLMDDMMATPAEVQTSSIKGFIDQGLIDHLLMSQNADHVELFTVNGGDGYAHVLRKVAPRLIDYHVTAAQIRRVMVDNPRRFLSGS